jgi:small subunit ribosomal protein S29
MPARGEKRTFQKKKKKGLRVNKGNPPAPGERKAYKKRVVLSNVNALEVAGLADLEEGTALEANMQGTIMGLPGPLVDRLRALGAFKPTQSWGMFKRPATLIRPETLEIANVMSGETESNPTQRLILTGERGSGKSVLLLQAQALALLKDWVVITIPDGAYSSSSATSLC